VIIEKIISKISGVPTSRISEDDTSKLKTLEADIKTKVIGQDKAVELVAQAVKRSRAGLNPPDRPIASFLFAGPTGVGKTELAKSLADVMGIHFERFDMSEYMEKHAISRLVGAPPGYVGYEQGGLLTEAARKHPYMILLLDEIEKAHPEIMNIFLQVMDDGRLTDGQGHLIDFTNSIIIATSNAGANYIQEEIHKGTDIEIIRDSLINEHLNKVLRPELINRFDGVIVFEPLSLENVVDITRLMLRGIEKLLIGKGMEIRIDDEGLRKLAKLGFDPKFGARPLRRLLQDRIENQIANKILAGELKRRDTVFIDAEANVAIEKAEAL